MTNQKPIPIKAQKILNMNSIGTCLETNIDVDMYHRSKKSRQESRMNSAMESGKSGKSQISTFLGQTNFGKSSKSSGKNAAEVGGGSNANAGGHFATQDSKFLTVGAASKSNAKEYNTSLLFPNRSEVNSVSTCPTPGKMKDGDHETGSENVNEDVIYGPEDNSCSGVGGEKIFFEKNF